MLKAKEPFEPRLQTTQANGPRMSQNIPLSACLGAALSKQRNRTGFLNAFWTCSNVGKSTTAKTCFAGIADPIWETCKIRSHFSWGIIIAINLHCWGTSIVCFPCFFPTNHSFQRAMRKLIMTSQIYPHARWLDMQVAGMGNLTNPTIPSLKGYFNCEIICFLFRMLVA